MKTYIKSVNLVGDMKKYVCASDSLREGQLDRMVSKIKDRGAEKDSAPNTTTPITDRYATKIVRHDEIIEVVNAHFARQLEREIRTLLLGTFVLYEKDPLHFAPETIAVFEKWKPEIEKMLRGE